MVQSPGGNGRKLALAITLLVLAAGIFWFFSRPNDGAFTRVAYAYLPLDTVTTDPAQFIMIDGNATPPAHVTLPDGREVYPVYSHPSSKVVPLVDGKILYFPVRRTSGEVVTPPLPPNKQPLSRDECDMLRRYLSDAARTQLQSALQGTSP